jgi:epoxyqueuosine reductase QueG
MQSLENLGFIRQVFEEEATKHKLRGILGVASFEQVFSTLLPVQQKRMEELCSGELEGLMGNGSVISIAYAFPKHAIDAIAVQRRGGYDRDSWNIYAGLYRLLNKALDETAERLADKTSGVGIPATLTGVAGEVEHVEDYYSRVISHRVAAELSGVGWRGKNELIVNPVHSCAIRLASIVTGFPLERTESLVLGCGNCRACLDVCNFLQFKDRLDNYREQCRRYIIHLDLDADVCGKCIKTCFRDSIYRDTFKL